MAGGERYTTTYSSTPAHLTRAYVIPPIENDPHFRARQLDRARNERATTSGASAAAARRAEADAAAARRLAERGANVSQSGVPTAVSASPRPPMAAQRRAAQAANPAVSAQRQSAYAAAAAAQRQVAMQAMHQTGRTGQTAARSAVSPGARSAVRPGAQVVGGAAQPQRKRKSALGRAVSVIIFLVLLGTVFRPAIANLFEAVFPDGSSSDSSDFDSGASYPEPDPAEAMSTTDLQELIDARDNHVGEEFTAYAFVTTPYDSYGDDEGASYAVDLTGYQPTEARGGGYASAVVTFDAEDDPMLVEGDILIGLFGVTYDDDHYNGVTALSWLEAEPYDLENDFVMEEAGRDGDQLTYDVTITNSADVEMSYSADFTAAAAAGSGVGDGNSFVWSGDPLGPGESMTVSLDVIMSGLGDTEVEPTVSDPERY